jgi:hypothetical protein
MGGNGTSSTMSGTSSKTLCDGTRYLRRITAVNGEPVRNISDLATIFEHIGVGKPAQLNIERDGRSRTPEVTVADVAGLMQG